MAGYSWTVPMVRAWAEPPTVSRESMRLMGGLPPWIVLPKPIPRQNHHTAWKRACAAHGRLARRAFDGTETRHSRNALARVRDALDAYEDGVTPRRYRKQKRQQRKTRKSVRRLITAAKLPFAWHAMGTMYEAATTALRIRPLGEPV